MAVISIPGRPDVTLERVDVTFSPAEDQWTPAHYTVTMVWAGVDRPIGAGSVAATNINVANRLARAWRAGAALDLATAEVRTDVNGQTYVSVHWTVRARCLNADLKRLGY